jgi:Zn-dependent protease with chaperone function
MSASYTAIYHLPDGSSFPATIFVSAVTITIRYTDQHNQQKDVYWLEKELAGFEERPGGTEIQYLNQQGQLERLIITDPELVQVIKKQLSHNRRIGKPHQRVMGKAGTKLLVVLGIIAGLFFLTYLWFVPWLGEKVAMNFSKDYEISMGNQMYEALAASFKIDQRKTEMVNRFYKQLEYTVDYPIEITVVESGVVNAFAVPGGHIVVYDAILEKMKTPEELAALLGHEASHVALRHSLRNMFRSLARKMFLALVFGNQAGIFSVMVNNADDLKGLEYSRGLETEADNNGLQLMAKSGLDPEGMVRLMELLRKESGDKEPSSLLNTHPQIEDRIKNIRKLMPSLKLTEHDNAELKKTFHAIYEQW